MPKYMTTEEVAQMFRTSAETVRYWAWSGKGPRSTKIGRRRLYDEADVRAWAEAQNAGSAA